MCQRQTPSAGGTTLVRAVSPRTPFAITSYPGGTLTVNSTVALSLGWSIAGNQNRVRPVVAERAGHAVYVVADDQPIIRLARVAHLHVQGIARTYIDRQDQLPVVHPEANRSSPFRI